MNNTLISATLIAGNTATSNLPKVNSNLVEIYIDGGLANISPAIQNPIAWINKEPKMPEIKVVNRSGFAISAKLTITYDMKKTYAGKAYNRKFEDNYPKENEPAPLIPRDPNVANIENGRMNIPPNGEWIVHFNEEIRGGKATLEYRSDLEFLQNEEPFVFHIRGENPEKLDVYEYVLEKGYVNDYPSIVDIIRDISQTNESEVFKQFNSGEVSPENQIKGLPNYRTPSSIGLMFQKDSQTDQLAWDWKANIDSGKINLDKTKITKSQLKKIFPNSSSKRRQEVTDAINANRIEFGIYTFDRMAHFLGQIGTETGELNDLQEGYRYSDKAIYNIFLLGVILEDSNSTTGYTFKYHDLIEGYDSPELTSCPYDTGGYGHERVSDPISVPKDAKERKDWTFDEFSKKYAIKTKYIRSKKLFDYVYGCRMGNGAMDTMDGSNYAGVGFIQLTGKNSYKEMHDAWNRKYSNDQKDFMGKDITLLTTNIAVAIKASMIFWELHKLNAKADKGSNDIAIAKVSKDVNGGVHGLEKRKVYTKKAYEVLTQ